MRSSHWPVTRRAAPPSARGAPSALEPTSASSGCSANTRRCISPSARGRLRPCNAPILMKRSAVSLLDRWGAVALARALQRSRAVVLTYHGVLDGSAEYDYLNHNFIAAEVFDSQMRYIRRHYRPIALRELVAAYREGRTPPQG